MHVFRLKLGKLSLNYSYYPFLSEALLRAASSREAIKKVTPIVSFCKNGRQSEMCTHVRKSHKISFPLKKMVDIQRRVPMRQKVIKLVSLCKNGRHSKTCTHVPKKSQN